MILEILEEINSAKGKAKISVLEKYKEDIVLQEVWHMAYSRMNFGTSVIVSPETGNHEADRNYGAIISLLDSLRSKKFTGNKAKLQIQEVLKEQHPDCIEVYNRIIKSNLKCGIGFSAGQKVYGKTLFKKYPVMLISPHCNKKASKIISDGAILQLKSDGVRGIAEITREGVCNYFSRNGEVFNNLSIKFDWQMREILEQYLWEFDDSEKFSIDGEFVVIDDCGVHQPSKSSGIMKKCIEGTATVEDIESLTFYVWDIYEEDSVEDYFTRLDELRSVVHGISDVDDVKLVESWSVHTLEEVHNKYSEIVKTGNEGVVLKSSHNIWKDSRVTDCIKYKEKHRADLKIVDYYLGEYGKEFQNVLGGYVVKSACGKVVSNTGSGLSFEDRGILMDYSGKKPKALKDDNNNYILDPEFNFSEKIDSIVSIEYNRRTQVKDDSRSTWSLRFPIIKQFRDDKSEADTLEEMIDEEGSSYGLRT